MDKDLRELPIGKSEILRQGNHVAILAVGSMVAPSLQAAEILAQQGIEATVVNARFIKPVDAEMIVDVATRIKRIITVEENTLSGGFGNYVNDTVRQADISDVIIRNVGLPDVFVEHGRSGIYTFKIRFRRTGNRETVLPLFPVIPSAGSSGKKTT